MKISVVGTGYVGLVSGACLAAKGHNVTCVDIDPQRVIDINNGIPPIHEDGLPELMEEHVGTRLIASGDLRDAVLNSSASLIAVGTPYKGDEIDLQFIRAVATQIGEVLADKDDYHVVIVKSTVVPGTTEDVVLPLLEEASGKTAGVDFGVGMNPEFLREGVAIADFMNPDRIVLGGIDERTIAVMAEIYEPFESADKMSTTPRTAEMIKYTANSLLATLISFANEIGNISAKVGVDVVDVMKGVHLDHRFNPILDDGSRLNPSFLTYVMAGPGFGGSCFPKDVKALVAHGKSTGHFPNVLDAVIDVNERQPVRMVELLQEHVPDLNGARLTVLGCAFKPGTDDVRESPSLPIIRQLVDAGAIVTVHDPIALEGIRPDFGDEISYTTDLDEALANSDGVLVVTTWPEYGVLPAKLADVSPQPPVVDGRRMFEPTDFETYAAIGR
ncbi:MAG: UDP-glucose/GDP-mannose dehydrogenase family protein [Acidimicrobiales bacterium]